MAANNVKVLKGGRYSVETFRTEANVALGVAPGDAMIVGGTGTNYAAIMVDGGPTRGTNVFIGVTESSSSNTAALDGVVNIQLVGAGTIIQEQATTVANINTDAKLLVILNDVTNFDRSAATAAGVLTIDETNTTAAKSSTLSLVIISGDIQKGSLRVSVQSGFFESNI